MSMSNNHSLISNEWGHCVITDGVPPGESQVRERSIHRNKTVWSSFLGTRVTERNEKSTVAKVSRLRLPLCFSWIFPSSRCPEKVLRWSVGIQPTLKRRLNILSLALSWALWCCLCCTHVIFNRVEPPPQHPLSRTFSSSMVLPLLHPWDFQSCWASSVKCVWVRER